MKHPFLSEIKRIKSILEDSQAYITYCEYEGNGRDVSLKIKIFSSKENGEVHILASDRLKISDIHNYKNLVALICKARAHDAARVYIKDFWVSWGGFLSCLWKTFENTENIMLIRPGMRSGFDLRMINNILREEKCLTEKN